MYNTSKYSSYIYADRNVRPCTIQEYTLATFPNIAQYILCTTREETGKRTLHSNWSFNTSNFNTSRDDDSVSIDIELEKQLNKHFGISSSAGTGKKAASSFMGVVRSASSLGATNTTNTAIGFLRLYPVLQGLVLPPPQ